MKRIRILEFFRDYDNLRKGLCTEEQFRRVLCISDIKLSESEIQTLLDRYQLEKWKNGRVDYKEFCDEINLIFTVSGIDKNPLMEVSKFDETTTLPARRRYLTLTTEESEQLRILLNQFHKEIQNKRVLMKPHFANFDITKQGYISKNQFLRILNQFNLFPKEEALNLILKRYTDKGTLDEVNYYEFCRDVDIYDEGVSISKNYADQFKNYKKQTDIDIQQKTFIHNEVPNDVEDLLAKLRRKTKEQRIRLEEFLRDYDKLRSGVITLSQLRKGLNMASLPLSDNEFNLLVQYFKSDNIDKPVRWRDFCDNVNEVFTIKKLEKQSLETAGVFQPRTDYLYGKQPLTQEELEIVDQLKRRFGFFCKATRIDFKQFFKYWDRSHRNKVSPKQFRQVLSTVNFNISDAEFHAIIRIYSDNEKDVRYVDFINDTLIYSSEFEGFDKNPPQPPGAIKSDIQRRPIDVDVTIDEIKDIVKVNRLRPGEYFQDFDPLRRGILPANKFRGVISAMKIDLPEEALAKLEDRYRLEWDPTQIDYARFLSDINIVFTLPELDKDPLLKPPVYEKATFLDPRDVLSEVEEQQLHSIMSRLGEVIRKHRIMFKTHFQDKDKAKSGKVSFTRFRSILDFHKLPLNEGQFNILCKRFNHQGIEFNYIEFIQELKKYEENY